MSTTWKCAESTSTATYASLEQAWTGHHAACTAHVTGPLDQIATGAARTAAPKNADDNALRAALEAAEAMCARNTPAAFDDITAAHPATAATGRAALALCPDHPQWVTIARRTAQALVDARNAQTGGTIVDGTWSVGRDVKPGVYHATAAGTCYWQRTAPNGQIVLNGIVQQGQRAAVTIDKTDAGFTSKGCGTWVAGRS